MTQTATISLELLSQAGPAEGEAWVHLLPSGRFSGNDGRGPWIVDNAQEVIAASRAAAGRRLLPIDYDHQLDYSERNGQPAIAARWIKGLQARADGVWGLVEWTERAARHLANREYRYLSPVFHHSPCGKVTRLIRAALTNKPALDQLTALASMEDDMDDNPKTLIAELRKLLGLPDDATAGMILAKLREMMTARQSSAPDPSQYVPIGDFERVVEKLNAANQGIELAAAADHVASQIRQGNMPSFLTDWGIALCSVNKPAFDAFIQRTKGSFNRLLQPTLASASPPSFAAGAALSEDETAVCRRMGLTDADFVKGKSFLEAAKG